MAWFEQKATEVAIGHIRGFIRPTEAEREAAFELFIELSGRGNPSAALDAWEQLLATGPDVFGATADDVNAFRIEVGRLSHITGDLDRAVALLEQAHRHCAERDGGTTTDRIRATHLLALAYRDRGQEEAAGQTLDEAIAEAAAVLPINDPLRVETITAAGESARDRLLDAPPSGEISI